METRKEILELRERLDKTLACSDLADEGSLRSLVKNQILESSLPGSDQGEAGYRPITGHVPRRSRWDPISYSSC